MESTILPFKLIFAEIVCPNLLNTIIFVLSVFSSRSHSLQYEYNFSTKFYNPLSDVDISTSSAYNKQFIENSSSLAGSSCNIKKVT